MPDTLGPYPLNSIITGDCREMAKAIPNGSVDIVITSPPYNVGLQYDGYCDKVDDAEHQALNQHWLTDAYRISRDGTRLYAISSDKMLWWFRDMAIDCGWTYGQLLTWCKPNFVGMSGRITNDWNYMTENILLFRKGKRTSMMNGEGTTHNWFVEAVPQSNFTDGRIHPAQMPVSLCIRLIDRTPGEIVYDPFCGSASVLVAAKKLGRKYLGIELVPEVAERARQRLDNTQPPLIVVPQPTQKEFDLCPE